MGMVQMAKEVHNYGSYDTVIGGYNKVETITQYVYCDWCGSFNVKKHISIGQWITIIIIFTVIGTAYIEGWRIGEWIQKSDLGGLLLCLSVPFVFFLIFDNLSNRI